MPASPSSSPEANPTTSSPAPSRPGSDCFQRTFRDDFDGTSLGSDWRTYTGDGTHSAHAVPRPEAVSVHDGMLHITAANNEDGTLVSGGVRHVGDQTYGRFAVRVRTDAELTNATSGVVLTWPSSNNQPRDGENDLYETLRAPGSRRPFYRRGTAVAEPPRYSVG